MRASLYGTPIFDVRDVWGIYKYSSTSTMDTMLVPDNLYLHDIGAYTRVTAQGTSLQLKLTRPAPRETHIAQQTPGEGKGTGQNFLPTVLVL